MTDQQGMRVAAICFCVSAVCSGYLVINRLTGDRGSPVVAEVPSAPIVLVRGDSASPLMRVVNNERGECQLYAAALAELRWRTNREAGEPVEPIARRLGRAGTRMFTISHWLTWDLLRRRMRWQVICDERGWRSWQCRRARTQLKYRLPDIPGRPERERW